MTRLCSLNSKQTGFRHFSPCSHENHQIPIILSWNCLRIKFLYIYFRKFSCIWAIWFCFLSLEDRLCLESGLIEWPLRIVSCSKVHFWWCKISTALYRWNCTITTHTREKRAELHGNIAKHWSKNRFRLFLLGRQKVPVLICCYLPFLMTTVALQWRTLTHETQVNWSICSIFAQQNTMGNCAHEQ